MSEDNEARDDGSDEGIPTESEVAAYIEGFVERVSAEILGSPDPQTAVARFVDELRADGGIVALMGSAFYDGQRDAMLRAARFADDDGPGPDWDGVEGGERGVLWREGHVCLACVHRAVCVVPRSIPEEQLVQVRRCLAFVPRDA